MLLQLTAHGESHEDHLAAASLDLLHGGRGVGKALLDGCAHALEESLLRHIARRRGWREEREPAILDPVLQRSGLRTPVEHLRAPVAGGRLEIGRQGRRTVEACPVRDPHPLEQLRECKILLFEKGEVLFEEHAEVVAGPLGPRPGPVTLQRSEGVLIRRRGRRGQPQCRNKAADDRAVEALVVGQILQDRVGATADEGELHRPPAEALLQGVEIRVEQGARVADDDRGIGPYLLPPLGPQVGSVVERRRVACGAGADFPSDRGGGCQHAGDQRQPEPGQVRDGPLKIGNR